MGAATIALVMAIGVGAAEASVNFNVTIGSETCSLNGEALSATSAQVKAVSCDQGRARIRYFQGTQSYYNYGPAQPKGTYSIVNASTSVVLSTEGAGALLGYWSDYKAYIA